MLDIIDVEELDNEPADEGAANTGAGGAAVTAAASGQAAPTPTSSSALALATIPQVWVGTIGAQRAEAMAEPFKLLESAERKLASGFKDIVAVRGALGVSILSPQTLPSSQIFGYRVELRCFSASSCA